MLVYECGHSRAQVLSEVSIDCGCATVAEVRKRGDDFWNEFEFYLSDLIVGIVLDVVLVSLLAPVAVIGARPRAASATGAPPPSVYPCSPWSGGAGMRPRRGAFPCCWALGC